MITFPHQIPDLPVCEVVFIGLCTAKKMEAQSGRGSLWVDQVMTFEELQALFDSRGIDLSDLVDTRTGSAGINHSGHDQRAEVMRLPSQIQRCILNIGTSE